MNSTSEYLFTKPIMNMIRITAWLLCPANNQVRLDKTQLLSKLLDMREQRNWNFNKKKFIFIFNVFDNRIWRMDRENKRGKS